MDKIENRKKKRKKTEELDKPKNWFFENNKTGKSAASLILDQKQDCSILKISNEKEKSTTNLDYCEPTSIWKDIRANK